MMKRIIKLLFLKLTNLRKRVVIHYSANIGINSKFEGYNRVGLQSKFNGKIGLGSYIGNDCNINADIGRFCSIANNVTVVTGIHPLTKHVSTSPSFFSANSANNLNLFFDKAFKEQRYANESSKIPVIIGNDVWIGFGVTLIAGIIIGDGAVILANATVTKDVPPYAIVAGIPGRILNYRFDENVINRLQELKWWNNDIRWLKENAALFSDINKFIAK